NIIFATNSRVSDYYVKNNLCSVKQRNYLDYQNYYQDNAEEVVSFNSRVDFVCSVGNSNFVLKWDNSFTCEGFSCDNFFQKYNVNKDVYSSLFNGKENKFEALCKDSNGEYLGANVDVLKLDEIKK